MIRNSDTCPQLNLLMVLPRSLLLRFFIGGTNSTNMSQTKSVKRISKIVSATLLSHQVYEYYTCPKLILVIFNPMACTAIMLSSGMKPSHVSRNNPTDSKTHYFYCYTCSTVVWERHKSHPISLIAISLSVLLCMLNRGTKTTHVSQTQLVYIILLICIAVHAYQLYEYYKNVPN